MEEFELSNFMKKGAELLDDTRKEFEVAKISDAMLPKAFVDEEPLKLVFVGQYSAGKSSIIKMLTGEDVGIGAKITTQSASAYPWNGLEIVDTPGIHTELRPDHDELTYEQINHAALLVFVITNEGFSQRIGDHFRTLAIDQKRAANMVLVVNKMDRTSLGNVPEQREIIEEDLAKVTVPYNPKDLYVSFVDTNSYFEGLTEEDAELKGELLDLSGHDIFVQNLNKFVESHKLLAKAAKPLYTIADAIRFALNSGLGADDEDIKAFVETQEHRKNLLVDGKKECMDEVRDIANECMNEISKVGRNAAENALRAKSEDEGMNILEEANNSVKQIVEDYSKQIGGCLKNSFEGISKSLDDYNNSSFVQKVNGNINERIKQELSTGTLVSGGVLTTLGGLTASMGSAVAAPFAAQATQVVTSSLGQTLSGLANLGTTAFLAGEAGPFAKLAGNLAGDIVKELATKTVVSPPTFTNQVAKFFVGNSKIIGGVAGALGVALTIYSIVSDNQKRKEAEEQQRKIRGEIIAGFDNVSRNVGTQMITGVEEWMENNVNPVIKDYEDSISQIQSQKQETNASKENLEKLLTRTENLIGEMAG